jgi:hypothetical protein
LTFAALPATTITSTLPTQAWDALLHFPLPLSFPAAPYPISQPVTFFPFQISTSPPYSFTTITNSITSLHGKITIPFCHCNSTIAAFTISSIHFNTVPATKSLTTSSQPTAITATTFLPSPHQAARLPLHHHPISNSNHDSSITTAQYHHGLFITEPPNHSTPKPNLQNKTQSSLITAIA